MRLHRIAAGVVLAVVAVLLVAGGPAAAQGSGSAGDGVTNVRFYGHVFGHTAAEPMPANVEYPVGEANYGLGTLHECTRAGEVIPLEGEANTDRNCENSYVNSEVLYSTAGFVDVSTRAEFLNGGGYSQFHNERGQAKPVLLDTSTPITASIHLTLDYHGWLNGDGETFCVHPHPEDSPCAYPYWGWDVAVQPDFQVEATLYSAKLGEYKGAAGRMPPIEETLRNGDPTIVAHGQTEPQVATDGLPGTPKVLEFEVPLGTAQVDRIPRTHDFFLVYKFYSNSSGERWGIHSWRIWAGEFFPPSFNLPVKNAFAVESVIPRFVHGKLAILGVMGSPWGSYDIDPQATELTVRNKETGEVVTPEAVEVFTDYSVAHGGHFDPANVSYIWDYKRDGLAPGTYQATIQAQNYQGSATASCTANFTVREGGRPGPTDVGTCGFQTLSAQERKALEEGADEQAGEGRRMGSPDPLPRAAGSALGGVLALFAVGRRP